MAYQGGLRRWFKEKWVRTDTGEPCGEGDPVSKSKKYCRPTKRINKKTPKTKSEMSPREIRKKKREKKSLSNSGGSPDKVSAIRKIKGRR